MSDYSINAIDIGKRIRELRKKRGKTQSYFADLLYISPSYLALIESGKRTPTLEVLVQISKICDVTLDYLVYGNDNTLNIPQSIFTRLQSSYSQDELTCALRLAEYYLLLSKQNGDSKPITI